MHYGHVFLLNIVALVAGADAYLLKGLRNHDSGIDSSFEYEFLNQSTRFRNNVFAMERQSDVLVKYSHPTFPKAIRDFTVVATVQLNDTSGGYLFAILNPLGTVVQLGLAIRPTIRFVYNITLIYTDTRLHLDSQTLAVFQVPAIKDEITVAIKVFLQKATLYINCNEVRTIAIRSDPIDVRTDSDSKLYVASAGPLGGEFDGKISGLKIYGDPDTINKLCVGNLLSNATMMFTLPPSFYAMPTLAAPTMPYIPFFPDFDVENNTITENIDYTQTTTPKPNVFLRLAALNEPFNGNLHGTRGADFSCHRQAVRAGVSGAFKAFLSTRIQSLQGLLSYAHWDVPISNIKGEVLFRSWKDLFETNGDMPPQSPRIYSFNGRDVIYDSAWTTKQVWHGSNINGEKSIESFCGTWEQTSVEKFGMAGNLQKRRLLNVEKVSCKANLIVLCIETIPREAVIVA